MNKIIGMIISMLVIALIFNCGKEEKRGVFFTEPHDGAMVTSPVKVGMGIKGMQVQPASDGVNEGMGHHHILINTGGMAKGEVIPGDDTHKHFGKGQTETELDLGPGKHRLTLQFADGAHQSYGPGWATTIEITVK